MKILITGPSWVGDMVMAQSLFKTLRNNNPDTTIDVLAPAWSQALLGRMPEVNKLIDLPLGHGELGLGKRRRLGRQLRLAAYDQAIILPNSFKSALVSWFADIPERTGWRGEARSWILNDTRLLDKQRYPLMVERFVALAYPPDAELPESLPVPALMIDQSNARTVCQKFALNTTDTRVLALCPGAEFGPSKQWPAKHYAGLASLAIEQGWQVWLFGSANDHEVAEQIKSALAKPYRSHCNNLAGSTTLSEAIDLLALSTAVVSNDSGLMHIAAALDLPLVVLYGSTSPAFTPPLAKKVKILSTEIECSPCFKRECPLGHMRCLTELLPERAFTALGELVV